MRVPATDRAKGISGRVVAASMTVLIAATLLALPAVAAGAKTANRRPIARAGNDLKVVAGGTVALDGSRSSDPDGDMLRYRWRITAKPNGSKALLDDPRSSRPGFTADQEGKYLIRLSVNDGKLNSRAQVVVVLAVYGELSNPISADDYQPIAAYGRSHLDQNSAGKKLLYLEGSAYQRGFAEGKLCPGAVYRMTHDYLDNVFVEILERFGLNADSVRSNPVVWQFMWKVLKLLAASNQDAVPQEYRLEMQGMADACQEAGYDVTFVDAITLNLGIDALESIMSEFAAFLCNEFAVFDNATSDGRLYHGRDFMFFTGGNVFAEEALLVVQNPESGYPFVASSAPGFIGIPTGMNVRGVSCGVDVVWSIFTRPLVSGEGCLLLCRKAVQYGGSLDEAVSLIRDSDRAVPWLYMVADGQKHDASVLETIASGFAPTAFNLQGYLNRLWIGMLKLFSTRLNGSPQEASGGVVDKTGNSAAGSGDLTDELSKVVPQSSSPAIQKGVMLRTADYTDPKWLNDLAYWFKSDESSEPVFGLFPRQVETYPDLVAMTNHYIIPWMAATYPGEKKDSLWRYDTMLRLLRDGYGKIGRERAMWIIDFLNPARCDYYGTDTTQAVQGHHVLMDNHSLEMWSLHGYYNDPWEHIDLDQFLSHQSR